MLRSVSAFGPFICHSRCHADSVPGFCVCVSVCNVHKHTRTQASQWMRIKREKELVDAVRPEGP